jgi:hypothetical protein
MISCNSLDIHQLGVRRGERLAPIRGVSNTRGMTSCGFPSSFELPGVVDRNRGSHPHRPERPATRTAQRFSEGDDARAMS